MAYRKTDDVIAEIEGRRERIIKAAFSIISQRGASALTSAKIAAKSKLSVGLIYKHFPDMDELRAHMFAQFLAHDLALLRAGNLADGIRAWAKHLAADPRSTAAVAAEPSYRDGIKRELASQIRAATGSGDSNILAAVVCGAVLEASGSMRPRDETALSTALLRACGIRSKANA